MAAVVAAGVGGPARQLTRDPRCGSADARLRPHQRRWTAVSVRVSAWVWDRSTVSGNSLLVLLAIADHANDAGGGAWPSVRTLAAKVRIDERSVRRILRRLETAGMISVDVSGGPGGANVYTVLMTPDPSVPRADSPPDPGVRTPLTPGSATPDTRVRRTVLNHQRTIRARGVAAPPPRCRRHVGQYAGHCGPCRSEELCDPQT